MAHYCSVWLTIVTLHITTIFASCRNGTCVRECLTVPGTIHPNYTAAASGRPNTLPTLAPTVPTQFNILVMLADFSACGGTGPAASESEMASFLFGRDSVSPTVEAQLRFCSHGLVTFLNKVIVTVRMTKCYGANWAFQPPKTPGGTDANCPNAVSGFVADLAEQASMQGVDVKSFENHWGVLDKSQQYGDGCTYNGIATLGRDIMQDGSSVGRLIITSWPEGLMNTQSWVHEFGHTLGLHHSSSITGPFSSNGELSEYGDASCALGGAGTLQRCFNVAHLTVLGWNQPQVVLPLENVAGSWTRFRLRPAFVVGTSSVQVFTGTGPMRQNWFISYRLRDGKTRYKDITTGTRSPFNNDDGVDASFSNTVHVHMISNEMTPSSERTTIVAILQQGQTWLDTNSGLRVRYTSFYRDRPHVHICRASTATDCA